MGTIWVKEFTGGLDVRRLPETTSGGVLMKAVDGHINRGGEFEKRAAFVPVYSLPTGATKGLAAGKSSLYVFGDAAPPSLPVGVSYQRLQAPDGTTALTRVPSYDLYAGKIYAVGNFADGSRYHFYDAVRVPGWFDGRARASFSVTGGTGSSTIMVAVDGIDIMSSAVTWSTSNTETASLIADAINSALTTPDYSATAVGETVNIVNETAGAAANGRVVSFTLASGFTVTPDTGLVLADGIDPTPATAASGSFTVTGGGAGVGNEVTVIYIDGVEIMGGAVAHTGNNSTTAAAIVTAINGYTSSPNYTATSVGAVVTITASDAGSTVNGKSINITVGGNVTVGSVQAMAGGTDAQATFVPGTFVKTIGSRMHAVSGPYEHFSGIEQPTKWTTETTGAGFIDMSTQASGAETLTSLAKYQQFVAVFAERVIQIWNFDSDPANNAQRQVLNNTGTASPNSVTQFGDNDLFYLDESGVRSLRARDASNAAATSDIGVPVDPLITEVLRSLTTEQRERVIGLIEPRDGRFWLIMAGRIFVFSFFSGSKISAWSEYTARTQTGEVITNFEVEDACVFRRKVYLRSGDTIYAYGGLGDELEYDDVEAEAWLPYLDANAPTKFKFFQGVDAAIEGVWEVRAAMDPTNLDASDKIATVYKTTFGEDKIDGLGNSTHISLRFKSKGSGAAKVSSAVIHYAGQEDED